MSINILKIRLRIVLSKISLEFLTVSTFFVSHHRKKTNKIYVHVTFYMVKTTRSDAHQFAQSCRLLWSTAAQNDITSNAACGFFKCETEMQKFVKCDFKGKKKSLKAFCPRHVWWASTWIIYVYRLLLVHKRNPLLVKFYLNKVVDGNGNMGSVCYYSHISTNEEAGIYQ